MGSMPPVRLLLDYALFLGDGKALDVHRVDAGDRVLGWMLSVNTNPESLPGRMYGFLFEANAPRLDLDVLYKDVRREFGGTWRVHLPPGVMGPGYLASYKNKASRYESHVTYLVEARSERDLWNAMDGQARTSIEKAEKQGEKVRVGWGGAQGMQYLSLHVRNNTREKLPPLGRDELARLRDIFGEGLKLYVSYREGSPVSGVLALVVDDYALVIDYAGVKPLDEDGSSFLTLWTAVTDLMKSGVRRIDLGFSADGQSAASRLKERIGGTQHRCYTVGAR